MHLITMTLLSGPGFPLGDHDRHILVQLALDRTGNPDAQAWLDDPEPWRAWLEGPDILDRRGDMQHDPDFGWYLRMSTADGDLADASTWYVNFTGAPARPGETAITRGPDGQNWVWRIVSAEAAEEALEGRLARA